MFFQTTVYRCFNGKNCLFFFEQVFLYLIFNFCDFILKKKKELCLSNGYVALGRLTKNKNIANAPETVKAISEA